MDDIQQRHVLLAVLAAATVHAVAMTVYLSALHPTAPPPLPPRLILLQSPPPPPAALPTSERCRNPTAPAKPIEAPAYDPELAVGNAAQGGGNPGDGGIRDGHHAAAGARPAAKAGARARTETARPHAVRNPAGGTRPRAAGQAGARPVPACRPPPPRREQRRAQTNDDDRRRDSRPESGKALAPCPGHTTLSSLPRSRSSSFSVNTMSMTNPTGSRGTRPATTPGAASTWALSTPLPHLTRSTSRTPPMPISGHRTGTRTRARSRFRNWRKHWNGSSPPALKPMIGRDVASVKDLRYSERQKLLKKHYAKDPRWAIGVVDPKAGPDQVDLADPGLRRQIGRSTGIRMKARSPSRNSKRLSKNSCSSARNRSSDGKFAPSAS